MLTWSLWHTVVKQRGDSALAPVFQTPPSPEGRNAIGTHQPSSPHHDGEAKGGGKCRLTEAAHAEGWWLGNDPFWPLIFLVKTQRWVCIHEMSMLFFCLLHPAVTEVLILRLYYKLPKCEKVEKFSVKKLIKLIDVLNIIKVRWVLGNLSGLGQWNSVLKQFKGKWYEVFELSVTGKPLSWCPVRWLAVSSYWGVLGQVS